MVYDVFKAHKTDEMKAILSINSTNLIMMPPGCTSKCQPLDVCIYKHFKGVLRNCWEDYVADIVTSLSEEEQNSEKLKLPSPSRQAIVNWVALTEPSRNDRKVFFCMWNNNPQSSESENDEFLRSIMQNVNEKIHEEEEGLLEECDEDPFYNM